MTAVLNSSEVALGETVQLEIRVAGARGANAPEEILVDGLEIRRTGTSQRIEMNNLNLTSSVIYDYTVMPLRAGRFIIPPQTIRVGNSSLRTPALTLNVADSSGRSSAGRSARDTQATSANNPVFAELIVPSKIAYVGQIVPVQIRMGFDPRVRPRLVEPPEITGQGFTAQKLQQSGENTETIGGRIYDVVTYKTAIAAARAGKFEIGPVKAKAQIVVPRRQSMPRSRPRSPFDLFDQDDPFSDPFFSNPFAQLGERREVEIKSEPVALEVKPLPPNAPPSFSGAIGNFTMTTEAKPRTVQVGDPITVTAAISGRGNFDRVNAPLIEDERGWHKYPPSSKFKQDDEVGISGTKTFEMVLSPNEKKQGLPLLAFSYFDPVKEQYVTLHSEPIPINVEGSATVAQNAGAIQSTAPTPSPATTRSAVQPSAKPQDILYQLTERPKKTESFLPIYTGRVFWTAQLIPLLALIGFAGWKIRRARIDNREGQRIAALQHEATDLMHKLHRNDVSPREYYAEASRVIRVKAALASGNRRIDPNMVDVETAVETFKLNSDSRDRLRRLFEQSDEWQYSGAHNGPGRISPESRREVLELLENLRA
ncbi:MAG TPA: BatD family protein [Candidatus Udaeobacter sp.]|nr:BatD family protein [Candidatus Udaeobacter sp.]